MFARIHAAFVRASFAKEEGQTMAEYGLIMAAIAIVAIVGFNALGLRVDSLIDEVTTALG
jgi:Flp pilus assembly pilin Flp